MRTPQQNVSSYCSIGDWRASAPTYGETREQTVATGEGESMALTPDSQAHYPFPRAQPGFRLPARRRGDFGYFRCCGSVFVCSFVLRPEDTWF